MRNSFSRTGHWHAVLLLVATAWSSTALPETIAIIGTGEVAGGLGPEFAAQGHEIVYGSRSPDRDSVRELVARTGDSASATGQADAVAGADIVVLAVPWYAVEEVVANIGTNCRPARYGGAGLAPGWNGLENWIMAIIRLISTNI